MNLVVYGTRPEEIKLYPFTKYPDFEFLQVDQSKDLHQHLIHPDLICEESELEEFIRGSWDKVIVQGDTRTAFRAAVIAFENKIPVVHIEAGMRTYDLTQPFPEEGYRQMIDRIATYHFCSTTLAMGALYKEDLFARQHKPSFVGQTSMDTLAEFYPKDVPEEDFYIVTVHRNESWDHIDKIALMLMARQEAGEKLHIYAHPNRVGQYLRGLLPCLDPLPYREWVSEMAKCKGFISDSGGLQEEAIFLGKEYLSLREQSERGKGETYTTGATAKIVEILKGEK